MIFCLIGHSASGKSTVEKSLKRLGLPNIVSYTTRPPREGERDGIDYYFIDEDTFDLLDGMGLFQEKAQYREWHYGISLSGVDYLKRDYIFVATIHGYEELLKAVGSENVVGIHIKADERERMKRLLDRGDEVDEIIRRIHVDRVDFKDVEEICDYVVENKNLDNTVVEVYNIINSFNSLKCQKK